MKNKILRLKKSSPMTSSKMHEQWPSSNSRLRRNFCFMNFKKYLLETTLHGLRFVGDDKLTIWERLFFLVAFIAAVCSTIYLISYIYARWVSTPVIIGIDPFPTSISSIPFPAVTVCNMNQLMLSKVANYSSTSFEKALTDMACLTQVFNDTKSLPDYYKKNNLSLKHFIYGHAQPCSRLIIHCEFSSKTQTCSDLFRPTITDEGYCCVFNLIHSKYRFKASRHAAKNTYTNVDGAIPVAWNPEVGYQKDLPEKFYPRRGTGIGVTMGLSITLDAEVDDYYCSSTNGPGFKISLHNPMEAPRIRDVGVSIPVGKEVRLRIDARSSKASPTLRSLKPIIRHCFFGDEGLDLQVHKFYTRRNCENECQANFILQSCQCIPYNLPFLYPNVTACGAPHVVCMNNAMDTWLRSKDNECRQQCLSSCFDLIYYSTSFASPLSEGAYILQNDAILGNMSRAYLHKNVAIIHLFFREFIFYGTYRNVYVGFTEFLSSTGGILGLFLGFSFISLVEAFYYAFVRPIFWWKRPVSTKIATSSAQSENATEKKAINNDVHWQDNEIFQPRRTHICRASNFASIFTGHKKTTKQTNTSLKSKNKLIAIRKTPWV